MSVLMSVTLIIFLLVLKKKLSNLNIKIIKRLAEGKIKLERGKVALQNGERKYKNKTSRGGFYGFVRDVFYQDEVRSGKAKLVSGWSQYRRGERDYKEGELIQEFILKVLKFLNLVMIFLFLNITLPFIFKIHFLQKFLFLIKNFYKKISLIMILNIPLNKIIFICIIFIIFTKIIFITNSNKTKKILKILKQKFNVLIYVTPCISLLMPLFIMLFLIKKSKNYSVNNIFFKEINFIFHNKNFCLYTSLIIGLILFISLLKVNKRKLFLDSNESEVSKLMYSIFPTKRSKTPKAIKILLSILLLMYLFIPFNGTNHNNYDSETEITYYSNGRIKSYSNVMTEFNFENEKINFEELNLSFEQAKEIINSNIKNKTPDNVWQLSEGLSSEISVLLMSKNLTIIEKLKFLEMKINRLSKKYNNSFD